MPLTTHRNPLISIRSLTVEFPTKGHGTLRAVDGADLEIGLGEVHGLVGESGSGKTVLALSILRLIDPPGRVVHGKILWQEKDLLLISERELNQVRGQGIAMVFQNAPSSLNPALRVQKQLVGLLKYRRGMSEAEARYEASRLIAAVHLQEPERILSSYPHELSGGMAQRVAIAKALACKPRLLIADEPTTALDVTVAAQLLELLRELRESLGLGILLISHDLGVIARLCDTVSVIYTGQIVERGSAEEVFHKPLHPYTEALLKSVLVPDPLQKDRVLPTGLDRTNSRNDQILCCKFAPRCPKVFDRCREERPYLCAIDEQHPVACWLYHRS